MTKSTPYADCINASVNGKLSDAALKRLRETFPKFDIEACLLKSVTINAPTRQ
jgi:hypothetical protein